MFWLFWKLVGIWLGIFLLCGLGVAIWAAISVFRVWFRPAPARLWAAFRYASRLTLWSLRMLFVLTPIGMISFMLHYSRSTFREAYVRAYFVP